MPKGSSTNSWRRRQDKDVYVRRARAEGWRSRAVFKLIEIQERDRLMKRSGTVIDLGAAPGGWSQYAATVVGEQGRVVALDLLEMDPIAGVDCIQGDFRDEDVINRLLQQLDGAGVGLVLSDMAPNISGNRSVDQPRSIYLAELALDLAEKVLNPGGNFVVKLFHGEGFDDFVKRSRSRFERVKVRKPTASRPESRETYLVARNYRL
jgi:23S rRNA (uridine2552-2'-O)-methyltransferase